MKHLIKYATIAALVTFSYTALAADIEAGKEKAVACAACHGETGISTNPSFPTLAGQHADYLEHAINGYKSGARKNAIMQGAVAGLSDEDIENVSAFFASQDGLKTLEK